MVTRHLFLMEAREFYATHFITFIAHTPQIETRDMRQVTL